MKILQDVESPPGGWKMTVPQTGVTLTAPFAKSLRNKVRAHLDANDIEEPDDFEEWFEELTCRESGHPTLCGNPPPALSEKQRLITPSKAKRFMRTVLTLLQDRKLVSREEAQRRMDICAECPMAGDIGYCWGCETLYRKIRRMLQSSPVEPPKGKRFCMACSCLLKAKTYIPNDTLDKAEKGDRPEYAKGCWRNEDPK